MEDYYLDSSGNRVFTADFLKKRQHCCKSSCLHCPYGHTLKTIGLDIKSYDESYKKDVLQVLSDFGVTEELSYSQKLVLENSGEAIKAFNPENFHETLKLIFLKGSLAGVLINENNRDSLYLGAHFRFQGIKLEHVLSSIK